MKRTKQRLFGVFLTSAILLVSVFALASARNTSMGTTASKVADDISDTSLANYIVVLSDAPVASYRGNIEGLSATNPYVNGESDLKTSEATIAYASFLESQQNNVIANLEVTLSRDLEVKNTFQYALNGFVAVLNAEEAKLISDMDGIRFVQRETVEELLTDVGPQWIGADTIWNATSVMTGTKGEGIVVAILDTGINSDHPSFADIGGDGYDHVNPLGADTYLGVCDPTNPDYQPDFVCNDKMIGVHDFIDGDGNDPNSPEDGDGHGTHTASTVAGNYISEATLYAPTTEISKTISGVAPHANIIAYDVCRNGPSSQGGGCSGAALLAAAEQVVVDHMQLIGAGHPTGIATINYSISGGGDPYNDAVELAFLAATDAGVFVSASAGNDGPGPNTVAHVSPWVGTVGASTHNRALVNSLVNITTTMGTTPLADIESVGFTAGYGPAELVYAGDYPNANDPDGDPAQCLEPYPAGTFNGKIVVCDRGAIARVAKGQNVLAGGAGGFVLANLDAQGDSVTGDAHFLPGIHIGDTDGDILRAYLADAVTNGDTVYATITGAVYDVADENGDIMAGFSSRGPVTTLTNLIKPDITAPGVSIWAAYSDNPGGADEGAEYSFLSGTSMSSPHHAGSVALMTALYPDWSPYQMKSALMLSSNPEHLKEDGTTPADPFDMGAGRVDLALAPNVGFVMDETLANFEAADPALGGDPSSLNLASMASDQCVGSCSWTRTVESTLDYDQDWTATVDAPAGMVVTVSPETFTLTAGGSQVIEITADVTGMGNDGNWAFAQLNLHPVAEPFGCGSINDFEAGIPSDWVIIQGPGNGWGTTDDGVCGSDASGFGNYAGVGEAACVDSDASGGEEDTYLCTPLIDLTGVSSAMLDYTVNFQVFSSTGEDLFEVVVTTDTVNYDTVGGTLTDDLGGFRIEDSGVDQSVELAGVSSADQVHACFQYGGDYDWYAHVDDVSLTCDGVAPVPRTLASAHMPIAVIPTGSALPNDLVIETPLRAGTEIVDGFVTISDVVSYNSNSYGLVAGTVVTELLSEDPTNGDPYDDLNDGVFFVTMTVGSDVARLVAETYDSDSPDLDLYVGTGDTPSAGTQVCVSGTATAVEYCNINNPAAGTWWVLVQNWSEEGTGPHTALLSYAVVDAADAGNMTVDGPSGVSAGDEFSINVNWDEPTMEAGSRWYGAFSSGIDAGDPDSLGTINVDLIYIGGPQVEADTSVHAVVAPDGMATKTYMIGNVGTEDLEWSVGQGVLSVEVVPSQSTSSPAASSSASLVASLVEEANQTESVSARTPAGGNIIWEQVANGTNGIVSDYSIANTGGGYSANDFALSAQTQIDSIFTPGFDNGNILGDQSLISWVIYADAGGVPAGNPDTSPPNYDNSVWFYTSAVDGTGVDITDNNIFLDLDAAGVDLVLPSGTYWLSVFVNYDSFATGRWNWNEAEQVGEQTQLVGNLFGVPDWTGLGDLGLSFSETAFTLTGMTCVSNDLSWVSLSPTSGTTAPGETSYVDVMFDATGVSAGSYEGIFCIETNDPTQPYVELTVSMDVTTATANLQAVHLAPFASGDAAVDIIVDGNTAVTDLVFGEATGYLALPAGSHEVEVVLAGTSTVALSGVYTLDEDVDYSLLAVGGANGYPLELVALVDNDPAAGGLPLNNIEGGSVGYVRVGHLAPFDATVANTAVNIINDADGSTIVPNAVYGTVTGYLALPVGDYDLSIELTDGTPLFDLAPVTVAEDAYIAAYAIGDGVDQANDVVASSGDGGMLPSILLTTRYIYLPFITTP